MKTLTSLLVLVSLSGCAATAATTTTAAAAPTTLADGSPAPCQGELAYGGGPTDPNSNEVRQSDDAPTTATPTRVGCR